MNFLSNIFNKFQIKCRSFLNRNKRSQNAQKAPPVPPPLPGSLSQSQTSIAEAWSAALANFPNVQIDVVRYSRNFCLTHLQEYGLEELYVFGSRTYGAPRDSSDHDFFAVVSDNAPFEINTGGTIHSKLHGTLDRELREARLGKADLLIARRKHFAAELKKVDSFATAAHTKGVKIYPDR